MASRSVGVHEAKTQLSRILREVEAGDEVTVTRGGTPVARIVAPERSVSDWPSSYGKYKGQIWMSDDFDDEDPEINAAFGTSPPR